MKNKLFSLKSLSYFYLGFILSVVAKIEFYDWRFYVIVVPFIFMRELSNND